MKRYLLIAMIICAPAHADEQIHHVHAITDIVAAIACYKLDFPYMLRIGEREVICLRTNVGAESAVRVSDILKQGART